MDLIVAAIANNNFLKLAQDLASLNILNNLKDLNAAIAVNDFFDKDQFSKFNIYSAREITTIKQSNTFN